jgi:hypothetical protein
LRSEGHVLFDARHGDQLALQALAAFAVAFADFLLVVAQLLKNQIGQGERGVSAASLRRMEALGSLMSDL